MIRRSMTIRAAVAAIAVSTSLLFETGTAWAEPSAAERATAEALFQQGTELMNESRFAPACEKFEGSQQLDPALGTMMRLADCYDRIAKTASAWALFRDAISLARTRGEAARERFATERAADLEKRLSKLELRVDRKNAPAGLEIQVNGMTVPRATWDAAFPVDPGPQRITASAPDRIAWSMTLQLPAGSEARSVDVPALAPKPRPEPQDPGAGATRAADLGANGRSDTLRNVAYVAGSFGIAGLAVGGVLSFKAYDANQQSLQQCRFSDPNACTAQGKDTRDRAKGFADVATVAFVASGALIAGGVALLLTTRSTDSRAPTHELKASPTASLNGAGIRLEATW